MPDIEFRLRRSEDEYEPFYVRIAEVGDGPALAFTENDESEEAGAAATAALRAKESVGGARCRRGMGDQGADAQIGPCPDVAEYAPDPFARSRFR